MLTRYRPQLDGLRWYAVLGVLVFHLGPLWSGFEPLGIAGVRLFFVLSGYLITSILLVGRRPEVERGRFISRFYQRRFLRIFPVYYAVLALAFVAGIPEVRENLVWFGTYATNFLFVFEGWQGPASHLWSLAVEEQFYLVWPFVILLAPVRHLKAVLIVLGLFGIAWRGFGMAAGWGDAAVMLVTPASLDTLCIGALLALAHHGVITFKEVWLRRSALVGTGTLIFCEVLAILNTGSYFRALVVPVGVALLGVWLVDRAAKGFDGVGGFLLGWRPLVYLGKISYATYLLHLFMPSFLVGTLGLRIGEPHTVGYLLIVSGATILLASLSWHLFEGPINRLKRHIPYPDVQRPTLYTGVEQATGSVSSAR